MSRSSQTRMAVLGALSIEPMTAYALRVAIRDVLGHFWSESFGQIYPALRALEDTGRVRRRPGARAGSSVFEITESGSAELLGLLLEPVQDSPPRDGLLLRLFFGRALGPEHCAALLRETRDAAGARLRRYEGLLAGLSVTERDTPDWAFVRITLRAAIHQSRSTLEWAEESLTAFAAKPAA
ncbi:PadR family transcriptional regulator [Actinoplanes sp. NPDC049802]|uniref:PadR family transcriptional regulator n=1 Tax=Actinoplanes sp. NPDC049802 TaxID=3154742 RepID=UPI00340E5A66